MSLNITVSFIAHTPARASDLEQLKSDISTWAANLQSNNRRTVLIATPWTEVVTLTNSGTVGDTNVSITAQTSNKATHALVRARISSGASVTEATFVRLRKTGDSTSSNNVFFVNAPPGASYETDVQFVLPLDASQTFTYDVNANASGIAEFHLYVVGYFEASLT